MSLVETISANATPAIRWFKELFTRQALIDGAKTLAWVAPLTILVWVYAEQQKPAGLQTQTLQVEFHTADSDRIVTPVNSQGDMIMVKLSGSKSNVDEATEALNKPGENPVVRINIPAITEDGQRTLAIADQVREADVFKKYGVTVDEVSPPTVDVNIDTLSTLDVDVKAPPGAALEGTSAFTPHTVKLTAPMRMIQVAKNANRQIVAYAQIPTDGDAARPGIHENILLPIEGSITGEHVSVAPATVTASYTVKQSDITANLDSLSIFRVFGGGLEDQYEVDGARTNIPVTIIGPPKEVNNVVAAQNTTNQPFAYFRVDSSESSLPSVTKTLKYELGEENVNVKVVDPKGQNTVTYSVKKRQTNP